MITEIPPPAPIAADPTSPYARSSSSHTTAATATDHDQNETSRDTCEAKKLGKEMARLMLEAYEKTKADELKDEEGSDNTASLHDI